ncbi:luciferase domain-containing protein [Actinoallomurus acaciae]|uniref:Luciferase family protein n=1 Tax=Actinoallomurus acaciae TaxID=502577 RepID=A0ABV5Y9X6_9ACTN
MSPAHRLISCADLVIDRFQNWPLRECRANCPPGRALALHGLQLVHLHRDDLAEVFLTHQVIRRLGATLTASGRVDLVADTDWVQVHLDTNSDLSLLESLVSLAIQANDPASRPLRPTMTICPRYAASLAS